MSLLKQCDRYYGQSAFGPFQCAEVGFLGRVMHSPICVFFLREHHLLHLFGWREVLFEQFASFSFTLQDKTKLHMDPRRCALRSKLMMRISY
jgi:hypothetical protein